MAGGRSGDEEHAKNGGVCLSCFSFEKLLSLQAWYAGGKRRFGWLQTLEVELSPLSEGDGMGQIHGHAADLGCLVLRPKCLKEETVVTHRITESQNVWGWKGPLWVI